ncbi:accessory gene regulator ArgB-like protein [Cohnella terricola]|uniref:Accessory regulator AgrB n=1 Tax=Cohnella terricola TaxID=1289167 RepID=A0A559IV75_9BACL|nr:accessory gene regulator B family protein [Cohnella terricola]TVX91535.1 accessory regulator AgrB [Cohnella terricola]
MIERVAHKLAVSIKHAAPDHPASIEVLKFPIVAFINAISIVILSIGVALLTNRMTETIIALVGYALLRQVSGGIHIKSGELCILVSVFMITIFSMADFTQPILMILNSISLLLVILFAPSRIENQTRIPPKYYPILKIISALMISTNFLFNSSVLSAAYFVQSMTLIRWRR